MINERLIEAQVAHAPRTAPTIEFARRIIDRRTRAAEALGEIGPAARVAIAALDEALMDDDLEVCARAAEALGRIGPAAVPMLVQRLKASDSFTLCWLIKALEEIGPEADSAVPALTALQVHKDATIRFLTNEALRKINVVKDPRSRPTIIQSPED